MIHHMCRSCLSTDRQHRVLTSPPCSIRSSAFAPTMVSNRRFAASSGPPRFDGTSWFPVVVGEYLQRHRERQYPPSASDSQLSKERFDSMTDAIKI
jgi:hypothetical protein